MLYEPLRFGRLGGLKCDNEEDHGDVKYGGYPSL
jgi:hypothetical protein